MLDFWSRLTEEEILAERKAEAERMKTAEGKLEEKLRLQKMEENANLVNILTKHLWAKYISFQSKKPTT